MTKFGTLLNERYRLDAKVAREARVEFEAMGAHGYIERVKTRLEALGAG